MEPTKRDLQKIQEYADGKYAVYTFSGQDGSRVKRLACSQESICVLPFDLNEHGQIKNVYLAKYQDYLSECPSFSCIADSVNKHEFDTYLDAVSSCVKNEMGISQIEVDDVYFLGKVNHGLPFSKEFRCYGLNLSRFSDPADFVIAGLNPNPNISSIEKVRFNRLIKGEVADSLVLSCALLLLSYISD
jgi:hypothetical protein